MDMPALRVYGGVEGDHRRSERRAQLVESGLDLLGGDGDDQSLTVRGVCKHAGLTARYFYENFTDREALAVAVYDHVIEGIITTTLEAVGAAPADARAMIRAGLENIVSTVADDPRKGRLLFSAALTSKLLAHRRLRSSRLFASLLGGQAKDFYGLDETTDLEPTTQFLVGGLAQTLTAWLDGMLGVGQDKLVDHCTGLFLVVAEPTKPGAK